MSAAIGRTGFGDPRLASMVLAGMAGVAAMLVLAKPAARDTLDGVLDAPMCATNASTGESQTVTPLGSYALPNVPGKRVTIVRVAYGPGGWTAAHRHAGSVTATVTKGVIRSQLDGGPVQDFTVRQTFFEPPGAIHRVSANASATEPAELLAVFVAEEGAQLTTFLD